MTVTFEKLKEKAVTIENLKEKALKNYTIEDIVIKTRADLANEYDVNGDRYKNYQGLCDRACTIFKKYIERYKNEKEIHLDIIQYHGEIKHDLKIESTLWGLEHSWIGLSFWDLVILYIDPTSQQFNDIFKDIPDYYISYDPPKWYLSDKDNPCYKYKFIKNHKILFNIVRFFQYKVKGLIGNIVRSSIKNI